MSDSTTAKVCRNCKQELPLDNFYKSSVNKDGYYTTCKICTSILRGHSPHPRTIVPDGMRRCPKCEQVYPATVEYFYKKSNKPGGLSSWCRHCEQIGDETRRRRNGLRPRSRSLREREGFKHCNSCKKELPATTEFFSKNRSQYLGLCDTCKMCKHQRDKDWQLRNKSKKSEMDRKYRLEHADEKRARDRAYHIANRDKNLAQNRMRYRKNRTAILEKQRIYNRSRPYDSAKACVIIQRRNARKRSLADTLTRIHWQRAIDYFDGYCAVCGRPRGLWHTLAMDHWIPLSNSDCPGTIPTNIVPLCHGVDGCNNSKNDSDPRAWLVSRFGARKANKILKRITAYFDWVKEQDG